MTNNSTNFTKDLLSIQDDLLRFAYKLTADREDANDLLQETSLKALDNEDKYMPETNFKGWVYTIMRNIFINNYRKIVRDRLPNRNPQRMLASRPKATSNGSPLRATRCCPSNLNNYNGTASAFPD